MPSRELTGLERDVRDLLALAAVDGTPLNDLARAVVARVTAEQGPVPAALRSWSVPWSEYRPVDVTPPELRPDALAQHVPAWAEAAPTPAEVHDWDRRIAAALVPYTLDERGWPLHPQGRTGRCGRNLGAWGENSAADPIVVAGTGDDRHVLLITRDDIGVEAIPGGMVDLGETVPAALARELLEETGVDLAGHRPVILGRDIVDDWRASDHAWVASTSAVYELPATVPAVAADDALDANWWPFGSLADLDAAISAAGRTLYDAHRPLLQRALAHLDADVDRAPDDQDTATVRRLTDERDQAHAAADRLRVRVRSLRQALGIVGREARTWRAAAGAPDRVALLHAAVAQLRTVRVDATALTGPVWYGQGFKDAITHLEELAGQWPDQTAAQPDQERSEAS